MTSTHIVFDSPVDELTLVSDGTALVAVWFAEQTHAPPAGGAGRGVRVTPADAPQVLRETARQLTAYFAGERTGFDLPTTTIGTPFQVRVWTALRDIPYGQTRSYGQLAAAIGRPGASRAVGAANGRNPLSIVVPCHRVIGSTGALTGYGGGARRKQILLSLERPGSSLPLW